MFHQNVPFPLKNVPVVSLTDISRETIRRELGKQEDSVILAFPGVNSPGYREVAAMAEEILVPLDRAEGKIAAAAVGLYPPGIPLLAPGERVTREIIRQLQEAGTRERFGVEGDDLRCANV